MKESFLLYLSFYGPIKKLPDIEKGQLFDAIFQHQMNENIRKLSPATEMAFDFIREQLDRDNKKYIETCDKNKGNARIRWNKENALASGRLPVDAKHADTDYDTNTDNDLLKENIKKENPIFNFLKTEISAFYHRKPTTNWNTKELAKLLEISKRSEVQGECTEIITLYKSGYKYHRKDIETLLNNWTGELDRARQNGNEPNRPSDEDREWEEMRKSRNGGVL